MVFSDIFFKLLKILTVGYFDDKLFFCIKLRLKSGLNQI